MKEKIANDAATANTTVDNDLDADLRSTILDSDRDVMQMYPEGSFQSIFGEQQKKAASLKDSRSMKWLHSSLSGACTFAISQGKAMNY